MFMNTRLDATCTKESPPDLPLPLSGGWIRKRGAGGR